jgi:outer membrane protein assembly factor BamB
MPDKSRLRRWLPWVAGVVALLVVAGGVLAYLAQRSNRDVSNPDVEFRSTPQQTTAKPPPKQQAKKRERPDPFPAFAWPFYGYSKDRNASFQPEDPGSLHPPYRRDWTLRGNALFEFPPVFGGRSGYLLEDDGVLMAFERRTGKIEWKHKLGALAASSPAYAHGMVYVVLLQRTQSIREGRVVALDAVKGKVRWDNDLPSRAESSPLVDRGRLIFGTEDGTVYCLDASDGSTNWTYKAAGAVKGAVAMDSDHNLYFADYGGQVHSVTEHGKERWSTGTSGGAFGLSAGTFYSTPAVAYGRVYVGNTDGGVYSFGTGDGRLAWRRDTGAYVYSSPAIAAPDGKPTVYIGSYDGNLYAFDARSGATRWSRPAGGKISGGIVALGDLIFYSTQSDETAAVTAAGGRKVWKIDRGRFNPAISDGRRIYVLGRTTLLAITPRRILKAERAARQRQGGASHRRSSDARSGRSKQQGQHRHRRAARRSGG